MEQSASRIEGSVVGSDYVVQSPYPDFELPEDDIYTLITKNFPAYGSRTCLIDAATGQEISYSEFYDVMRSFALGLQSLGFSKGDTVATNSVDFPVVCLGTLAAGGVLNMSKPNLSVDGFVNQFKDSCPKFVVTIAAILPTIKEAATRSGVEKIILMGKSDYENTVPYHSLFNKPGSHFSPVSISPDDVAILSYTSGTTNTGIPKGVVLTHRSICANILQQNHPEAMCPQNGDHVIVVPPLYHSIVVTSLPTFYAGSTVVILPRFEPELFLSTIEKYSNPILPLVPPFIVFLAKDPLVEKYRLTGIKDIITGAAPIGVDVMRAASERTNCNVCQAYGLTEVGPNSHMMSRSLGMTKPGSVGPCLQNFKVRVIDLASGEALPPGKEGELWTKGPNVANGYLNNPQATKEYITEDGWFKTGDLGYYDEDGLFYITERLKEIINVGDVKVAPSRLEAVLLSHPKIVDAAVIGTPDRALGQVPKAFVVRKEDILVEEIQEYVANKVSEHQRLVGGVTFLDTIPKTDTGKIKKQLLHAGEYTVKVL